MKRHSLTRKSSLALVASMLGLALVLSPIAKVRAAELQVLAGGAMTGPMKEIAVQFESATGHKLVLLRYHSRADQTCHDRRPI